MSLLGAFAALALLMAAVGLYGVLSYSVSRRMHEMGLRLALGASARDLMWLVMGQGVRLALLGMAVGLAASLAATRLLAGMLFGVSPLDPLTFAAVAGVLFAAALLASFIPARRATRVDPMVALRYE
jgi:putative ABC transport system permease protein